MCSKSRHSSASGPPRLEIGHGVQKPMSEPCRELSRGRFRPGTVLVPLGRFWPGTTTSHTFLHHFQFMTHDFPVTGEILLGLCFYTWWYGGKFWPSYALGWQPCSLWDFTVLGHGPDFGPVTYLYPHLCCSVVLGYGLDLQLCVLGLVYDFCQEVLYPNDFSSMCLETEVNLIVTSRG